MKYLFLFSFLCLSVLGYSQSFEVKGVVADKMSSTALESATVYVESISDSTLITYTISDLKGAFELSGKTKAKEVYVLVSYTGYKSLRKKIRLNKRTIDIGKLLLEEHAEQLDGVMVVGEGAPITVKKDTLEFNASSFKTRPDANLEDVLKKIPGVEVDSDGKVTVNGKEVNEVLVNGKSFFGTDPKIATKNLTKDMIDKIQVSNTKTDSEKFTGKKSESDNKSINITLKKDKNKGFFGRVSAGYGSDDRYDLSGMGNYFNNDRRLSVLASANNINSSGFSFDEVFDMMGSGGGGFSMNRNGNAFSINGRSFGMGQGITTSANVGANYVDELGENKDISADYFYAKADSENESKENRENFLPNGESFFTNSTSSYIGENDSHRLGGKLEFELDSTLKVTIRPSYNFSKGKSGTVNDNESFSELNGTKILENTSSTTNTSENERRNFGSNINIIKKFGPKGSYVSLRFNGSSQNNISDDYLNTERKIFGTTASEISKRQYIDKDAKENEWSLDLEYRQRLKEKLFLDLNYEVEQTKEKNQRSVYDLDAGTGTYSNFDTRLSSNLKSSYTVKKPTVGLKYEGDKLYTSFSVGLLNTELKNEDYLQDVSFDKSFNDLALSGRIRYKIKQGQRISFNYNTRSETPSVTQLQPIANESNLNHIIIGNPDLDRSYSHNIRMHYNNFDFKSRTGMFIYGSVSFKDDEVTQITTTNTDDFTRETTYTNVNGNYSGYLGGSYSKTIKKDDVSWKYRIGLNANLSKRYSFNNEVKYATNTTGITPSLRLTFNYKELVEIEPSYRLSINKSTYSLDEFEDNDFLNHRVSLRTTTYWPKNIVFGNDIQYSYNPNVAPGFDKGAVFWNVSLGLKMLKDKGLLKLKVYDLLDQNINTRRTVTADYISDSQGTVLKQYFMLSFSYKIAKAGGGKGRRGGRFMMH